MAVDKPRLEEIERLLALPTTTADERDNLEAKKLDIIERNPSLKVRNGLFYLDYEHTPFISSYIDFMDFNLFYIPSNISYNLLTCLLYIVIIG